MPRMHIDDARKKLAEMKAEYDAIPEDSGDRAQREYRIYLKINIDHIEKAIGEFEAVNNG